MFHLIFAESVIEHSYFFFGGPLRSVDHDSHRCIYCTKKNPASIEMAKGRCGKFTIDEIESLLDIINDNVPISNPEWEQVWNRHNHRYPSKEQMVNADPTAPGF